jgi:hypothetical protein
MSSTTVAHGPDGSVTVEVAAGGAFPNDALSAIVTTTGRVDGTDTGGSSVTGFAVVENSLGDVAPEPAALTPAWPEADRFPAAPAAGGVTLRGCALVPGDASATAPPPIMRAVTAERISHL